MSCGCASSYFQPYNCNPTIYTSKPCVPNIRGVTGPTGSAGITSFTLTNLTAFVDPVFGTASGQLENRAKPFDTVSNAINAIASLNPPASNYLIEMMPGTYTDTPNFGLVSRHSMSMLTAPT